MGDDIKRILAIDFGTKRIGLALSDPIGIFSYPFSTLNNDKNFFNELKKIIDEKNIVKIILGYPNQQDGKITEVNKMILEFKEQLVKKYQLQVDLWDETFTSEMAKQTVIKSVAKKSKRRDKGLIDQNSAAIILQEYLDSVKN